MRERGREAIAARLKDVFGLPFVMGAQGRVVAQEIRFIAPAVAVVITQVEREGQKSPSGEQLGTRRTSHQARPGQKRAGAMADSEPPDLRRSRHDVGPTLRGTSR